MYVKWKMHIIQMMKQDAMMWGGHIEKILVAKHRISMNPSDAAPIHAMPNCAGLWQRQWEKEGIEQKRRARVAELSTTEWVSSIVFVPKEDGSLWFCVDYHLLNVLTVRHSCPISRMDEFIDSIGKAKNFSRLVAHSGYWQIEMDISNVDKTIYLTHHGLHS